MRKTTEELWKQALAEQTVDSDVPETFRRLVIYNERECTEAVGVTASLPGTNNGYTFVAFNGSDVPVGTKLFTFPPAAIDRDSVIEALQLAHDHMRLYLPHYTEKHNVFDTVTRALKSQLAAPDPRDEVIRLSRETLAGIVSADYRKWEELANAEEFVRWAKSRANHALAAIDKVMKEGK